MTLFLVASVTSRGNYVQWKVWLNFKVERIHVSIDPYLKAPLSSPCVCSVKTLGNVTCQTIPCHNAQPSSLFTPTGKEMCTSRNPGMSVHCPWCTCHGGSIQLRPFMPSGVVDLNGSLLQESTFLGSGFSVFYRGAASLGARRASVLVIIIPHRPGGLVAPLNCFNSTLKAGLKSTVLAAALCFNDC